MNFATIPTLKRAYLYVFTLDKCKYKILQQKTECVKFMTVEWERRGGNPFYT